MMGVEQLNQLGRDMLPGLIGMRIVRAEAGQVTAILDLRQALLAPNGFLHAASVIALADTACGYGVMLDLPQGAQGFTTIELKTNFLRTLKNGTIICEARRLHGGKSTQVWDAEVKDQSSDRLMALFRCTQLLLYSRIDKPIAGSGKAD
ncbi:MAG: PaaI family thioesterase [Herpetosiphon sp.]